MVPVTRNGSKGSTRSGAFLCLKTDAQPASEIQHIIKNQRMYKSPKKEGYINSSVQQMPSTIRKSVNLSSPNFPHAKLHITTLQHIGVNMYEHYTLSCPTHLFCLSNHFRLNNIYNADCLLSIRSRNSNNDSINKINKHIQDTDSSKATSLLLLQIQQTKKYYGLFNPSLFV